MIGNVYAKFADEEGAKKAYNALAGKYYHSNLVQEEFSPVVNFKECRCRNYEEDKCERGGFCNFLHLKHVGHGLINSLMEEMYDNHPEYKKKRKRSDSRKKRFKKHEHSSSESSLDGYSNYHRKKIIKKWCIKYQKDKELEEKKKETVQAKINLALIEQKLSQTTKKAEDLIQPKDINNDIIDNNIKEGKISKIYKEDDEK
jgi:splicing factor U2AF subunit